MTRTEAVNHTTGSAVRTVMVFTDLDGTLMDHDSYDVAPAKPALEALAARSIPVVPVTSKTRTELVPLMARLGLSAPAIAENGAVIMNTDGSPDTADAREKIALALDALPKNIRKAMIYGSVVASICCEGFGLKKTTTADRKIIDGRFRELEKLVSF